MAARKHTVILELEKDVNVTLDLIYDSESETPYEVNISVLNAAGEKFTLSGNPTLPAAAPAATRTKAKARKAG